MAYSAKVMEHFSNPHNVGEIKDADGVGEVGNPKCGDIMRMYIKVDNDVITDFRPSRFTAPFWPSRPLRLRSPITTAAAASTPPPSWARSRMPTKHTSTASPKKTNKLR